MYVDFFLERLKHLSILTPLFPIQPLTVEVRPFNKRSVYLEITYTGVKEVKKPVNDLQFLIEGEEQELSDLFEGHIKLQQLIQLGKVKIKGSFRDFLRVDAIIQFGQTRNEVS